MVRFYERRSEICIILLLYAFPAKKSTIHIEIVILNYAIIVYPKQTKVNTNSNQTLRSNLYKTNKTALFY